MKKFADAWRGIGKGLEHKAIRTQFILGAMALLGGMFIRLNYYEWIAFFICIVMVISAEMLNTAIEKICDFICPERDERIRFIKDVSAGAVLIASLGAFSVCVFAVVSRFV